MAAASRALMGGAAMSTARANGFGMTDAICMWEQCDRSSQVAVSVGRPENDRSVHGAFCVPHAGLTSRALRAESETEVWLDWVRSVGDVVVDLNSARISLHHSPRSVRREAGRHAPRGEPRIRGDAGNADPLERAT